MSGLCPALQRGLTVLVLLSSACGCSTIRLSRPYETEDNIRAHVKLHRGYWWNYYERGSWFLAGGCYKAARDDFEKAAELRPEEQWDARTYGMHFIDYFPHREWGIALCLKGEGETDAASRVTLFSEAITQLQRSIDQEPSSRAWFYLNRATAGYWRTTQADATPPVVAIVNSEIDRWVDAPTLYTNRYTIPVEIQASDHQSGVAAVEVDGRRLFIEAVKKEFDASAFVTVDARRGIRTVAVTAADLSGNRSRPVTVRLIVDATPPIAAFTVLQDSQPWLGGRIPVKITAMDDRGLKSVRVGEDLYGSHECRGQATWDGILYAKPAARDLDIVVTDLAGNVTATTVESGPGRLTSLQRREPLLGDRAFAPYDHSFPSSLFGITQRGPADRVNTLAQILTADNHVMPLRLAGGSRSSQPSKLSSRTHKLVFPEFPEDRISVQTSRDEYLLRGEVRGADGLESITVAGKPIGHEQVMNKGDDVIFSDRVPLPHIGEAHSITVEASFLGDEPIRRDVVVERVRNRIYEPDGLYAVMLLYLKEEHTPGDSDGRTTSLKSAYQIVLNALRDCNIYDPHDAQLHPRFNRKALDKIWTTGKIESELRSTRTSEKSAKKIFDELAAACGTDGGLRVDLGVYGSIKEWSDSLEIKLVVINRKGDQIPSCQMDIFGSKTNETWHVEGLASKLKTKIPHITGRIIEEPKDSMIAVNCGKREGTFADMDLRLYQELGVQENRVWDWLCDATVLSVRSDDNSQAQLVDLPKDHWEWGWIQKMWDEISVVSK